jgi:AcrR family transcriptional regulator
LKDMSDRPNNETRTRLLDAAEGLFAARGYAAVKLRDIAAAVGLRHASLYYYVPGGKEQLFIEVTERNFQRHRQGMAAAIAGAGPSLREQLHAVADWLVTQPPLDVTRMYQSDMPAIDPAQAERLSELVFDALRLPIVEALERAKASGEIVDPDLQIAALALVSLVQSIHSIPVPLDAAERRAIGRRLVDLLLDGLRVR